MSPEEKADRGMAMTARPRVVGYVRVSTVEQAKEGISLAAQRVRIEAYCVAMELELVAVHEDAGLSAKTLDRPALQAALADMEAGRADGLVVAKLDRLTRRVVDLGTLLDTYFAKRFNLFSVADSIDTRSASGRMVLNILTSVAQWERERIGERVAEALAFLKSQGVHIGAAPLGTRHAKETDQDGRRVLMAAPEEQATLRRICELRAEGLTLRDIAINLEHEGRRTKRGKRWHPHTINRILERTGGPNDAA
jgi:site-specific DNA recombinase